MKKLSLYLLLLFGIMLPVQSQDKLGKLLKKAYPSLDNTTQQLVIVYLTDKGALSKARKFLPQELLSKKSMQRRLKVRDRASLVDEADLPLEQSYVKSVEGHVALLRHQLKWFNAVSALADKAQIDELQKLPFVKEIELIGRWKVDRSRERIGEAKNEPFQQAQSATSLNYGPSFTQLNQIKVPQVHDLGIHGEGITIAVFDNGVRLPTHTAFDSMTIIAQHDFVDHKTSVIPLNTSTSFGSHGVMTLSCIGGNAPGHLIGPAFKASFILIRSENDSSETPVEEDNWVAGLQWADSIGVDVTSTSLGYLGYDPPFVGYTWADMDGKTAIITKAAAHAAALGIVVVNAAGNEGRNLAQNTLIAPADADSIITAGAVASNGVVASFSSNGPTVDARIKPDVCAMGVSDYLASSTNISGYTTGSGTSFACPLTAGVAALVLSANPSLTPLQVRDAMRNTASHPGTPDNITGWGILDAYKAVNYLAVPRVSGNIFYDLNGNGVQDAGEWLAPGVTVRLTGQETDSVITDVNGEYRFDSLQLGNYSVAVDVPGTTVSIPGTITYAITVDSSNKLFPYKTFGLFQYASIHGKVFNDVNWNMTQDIPELYLADWPVVLSGPVSMTTYTDSSGNFSFAGLGPGTYTVRDSLLPNWLQTTPEHNAAFTIGTTSGLDTSGLLFGNIQGSASTYAIRQGWNLLAVSARMSDYTKDTLFPQSISNAFIYRSGYKTVATLGNGMGFWLKFDSNYAIPVTGTPIGVDTVDLVKGWNMIGSISDSVNVASIIQQPDSNTTSPYYGYDSGYAAATTLLPNHGYWIKAKAAGKLILQATIQTIAVQPKWNSVGNIFRPIATTDITSDPPGVVSPSTQWYTFEYAWHTVDTLFPGKIYIVKTGAPGKLILQWPAGN